jgi:oligoribonuclease
MNEWCVEQHGKSGLTQACRDSTVSLAEAEQQVLQFVQQHAPEPGAAQV